MRRSLDGGFHHGWGGICVAAVFALAAPALLLGASLTPRRASPVVLVFSSFAARARGFEHLPPEWRLVADRLRMPLPVLVVRTEEPGGRDRWGDLRAAAGAWLIFGIPDQFDCVTAKPFAG
jgi:hypothetical protein